MTTKTIWTVPPEGEGERLDRSVARHLDVARNRVQRWVRDGRVTVDGRTPKVSTALVSGQTVSVESEDLTDDLEALTPEDGPLTVLYEDADLAVVDKPAGIAVHPGAGRPTGTLAHRLVHRWPRIAEIGHPRRPGIVHRLDLDTTGALIVALSVPAYDALGRAFAERRIGKTYVSIVWGTVEPERRLVDLPLDRHPTDRKRRAVVERGRPARTHIRRLDSGAGLSWLEIDLETGRTHQIRVHCKAIGHPLVGDPVYGEARWRGIFGPTRGRLARFPRPALHAWRLTLDHPVTDERLDVVAPIPADLRDLWTEVTGREAPAPS